ncbi:hypothetical protein R1flu_029076 [Riccia fluitans]|uniref:Uncharacterized protein n=1 Tax=Riccia fluitans TaxID=41844 RepID=A0ABD1XP59_9MARC
MRESQVSRVILRSGWPVKRSASLCLDDGFAPPSGGGWFPTHLKGFEPGKTRTSYVHIVSPKERSWEPRLLRARRLEPWTRIRTADVPGGSSSQKGDWRLALGGSFRSGAQAQ